MSRTSTVVWSLIILVVAIVAALGAVYGPKLVREGKALVGPIVEIAQSEERLAELNTELPFAVPEDGALDPGRFDVFLDIRRDLLPHYLEWQHFERKLERSGQEDWDTAMEVLGVVQTIMSIQIDTLRNHGMSPAEFIWIEDLVYIDWSTHAEDAVKSSASQDAVREATRDTLDAIDAAERDQGASGASRRVRAHLERRLAELGSSNAPVVDGIPADTSQLFWEHRTELVELDLAAYSELHSILRGTDNVQVTIDPSVTD
jgi:hypothetical protein